MRATPADVVRFGAAFLKGDLVRAETRDMALAPVLLDTGERAGIGRYDVGFGWRTGLDWDGRTVAHHSGSTPGTRSVLLGYPDGSGVIALISNCGWSSRMETTAELLGAPFLEGPGSDDADCPRGAWSYNGSFDGDSEHGRLEIMIEDGLCVGELRSAAAMFQAFDARHRESPRPYPLVRVARRGSAHVLALAYPWGLAQLRLTVDEEGELRGTGDIVGRQLELHSARDTSP